MKRYAMPFSEMHDDFNDGQLTCLKHLSHYQSVYQEFQASRTEIEFDERGDWPRLSGKPLASPKGSKKAHSVLLTGQPLEL